MRLVFLFLLYVQVCFCFFFRNNKQQPPADNEIPAEEEIIEKVVQANPNTVTKANVPPTPDTPIKKIYVPGIKAEFWNNVTIEEFKTDAYLFKKSESGNTQGKSL